MSITSSIGQKITLLVQTEFRVYELVIKFLPLSILEETFESNHSFKSYLTNQLPYKMTSPHVTQLFSTDLMNILRFKACIKIIYSLNQTIFKNINFELSENKFFEVYLNSDPDLTKFLDQFMLTSQYNNMREYLPLLFSHPMSKRFLEPGGYVILAFLFQHKIKSGISTSEIGLYLTQINQAFQHPECSDTIVSHKFYGRKDEDIDDIISTWDSRYVPWARILETCLSNSLELLIQLEKQTELKCFLEHETAKKIPNATLVKFEERICKILELEIPYNNLLQSHK